MIEVKGKESVFLYIRKVLKGHNKLSQTQLNLREGKDYSIALDDNIRKSQSKKL